VLVVVVVAASTVVVVDVVVGPSTVVLVDVVVGPSTVVLVDVVVGSPTVVEVVEVVVTPLHGQFSGTASLPTECCRHSNASVAFAGNVPVGAQRHSGSQVWLPTAAWRMNRQSVATGAGPSLTG
jgi:hypothetical protein